MKNYIFTIIMGFVFSIPPMSAIAQTISSSIADGGSVVDINEGSSLHYSWITLNDADAPIQIEDTGIVVTRILETFFSKGFLVSSVPITAFEIRFVLYDIFGSHMKTLSATEVIDVATGEKFDFPNWGWGIYGNEAHEIFTVAAFVAQVRTADGEVWRYDEDAIAEELVKIQIQTTTEDLESAGEEG